MNKVVRFLFITCVLSFAWVNPLPAAVIGSNGVSLNDQSQSIGEDEVKPKSPILATFFSVIPGAIVHGAGNFYAGDYDDATTMLTMEICGGGIALWGYNIIQFPQNWGPYFGDSTGQAGYWIEAGGWTLIITSFIWDVTTSGKEVISYNNDHAVNFDLQSRGDGRTELALNAHF